MKTNEKLALVRELRPLFHPNDENPAAAVARLWVAAQIFGVDQRIAATEDAQSGIIAALAVRMGAKEISPTELLALTKAARERKEGC